MPWGWIFSKSKTISNGQNLVETQVKTRRVFALPDGVELCILVSSNKTSLPLLLLVLFLIC